MKYDYLVVGAGLFGAVFAQQCKAAGKSVLVIDKRSHIAGNGGFTFVFTGTGNQKNLAVIGEGFLLDFGADGIDLLGIGETDGG